VAQLPVQVVVVQRESAEAWKALPFVVPSATVRWVGKADSDGTGADFAIMSTSNFTLGSMSELPIFPVRRLP
jgi:hypothetical protein